MAQFRKITLTHNGVLTAKAMRAYVEGKLSDEQLTEVKNILANDVFAQDAFEGFKAAADIDAALIAANEVKEKIKDNTGAGKIAITSIQVNWALLAYAAAFIGLVLGIGFVFMMYNNHNQSEQLAVVAYSDTLINDALNEVKNTDFLSESPLPDSTVIDTFSSNIADAHTEVAEPQSRAVEEQLPDKKAKEEKKLPVASTQNVAGKSVAPVTEVTDKPSAIKKEEKAAKQNISVAPMQAQALTAASAAQSNEGDKKAKDEEKETAVSFDKAMKSFNAGDYKNAGALFEEISAKSPNNSEAIYFSGVCNYINGNKPKAEQKFDKLIKKGSYTEGSKWYKANILLSGGEKDDAIKILKQLTSSPGVFKARAIKKLEEIED